MKENINIEKYFCEPFREEELKEDFWANWKLRRYIKNISYETAVDAAQKRFGVRFKGYNIHRIKKNAMKIAANRSFKVPGDAVGLMPMYMQYVHNNISVGINTIELKDVDGTLMLVVTEGDDVNTIPVGFEGYLHSYITERTEEYNIATRATFCINEDKVPVLKIKIVFTEAENYRTITFFFNHDNTVAEFNENPSVDMILDSLDGIIPKYGGTAALINSAIEKVDPDIIAYALRFTFNPKVVLKEITGAAKSEESAVKTEKTETTVKEEKADSVNNDKS